MIGLINTGHLHFDVLRHLLTLKWKMKSHSIPAFETLIFIQQSLVKCYRTTVYSVFRISIKIA